MDIQIETKAVDDVIHRITVSIATIKSLIAVIRQKINKAGIDFTSINFFRAETSTKNTVKALEYINYKLTVLEDYLKRIIYQIEVYNTLKYNGSYCYAFPSASGDYMNSGSGQIENGYASEWDDNVHDSFYDFINAYQRGLSELNELISEADAIEDALNEINPPDEEEIPGDISSSDTKEE